ncbi:antitoxin VapB family protein [Nostocoides australiense]
MAVKTITIDLEAYDRLSRLKDGGLSFSQVIKKYLPAPGGTAADLLATLDDMGDDAVAEGTLDVVEVTVRDRRLHAVRVPTW